MDHLGKQEQLEVVSIHIIGATNSFHPLSSSFVMESCKRYTHLRWIHCLVVCMRLCTIASRSAKKHGDKEKERGIRIRYDLDMFR